MHNKKNFTQNYEQRLANRAKFTVGKRKEMGRAGETMGKMVDRARR